MDLRGDVDNATLISYYIYRSGGKPVKPFLFVPTSQFISLLEALNAKFGIALAIPRGNTELIFNTTFGEAGTPTPRYIKAINSFKDFEELKTLTPNFNSADSLTKLRPVVADAFSQKFAAICHAAKRRGKTHPRDQLLKIRSNRKLWRQMSKRTQRYLGLRKCKLYFERPHGSGRH